MRLPGRLSPTAIPLFLGVVICIIYLHSYGPQIRARTHNIPAATHIELGAVDTFEDQDIDTPIPTSALTGIDSNTPFLPPQPSVKQNVIRGDGTLFFNEKETTWHSVSRSPNRAECWTYQDRFQLYQKLTIGQKELISQNNERNKSKRAIILRMGSTQPWNRHFKLFVRSLVLEAGYLAKYDIVISVHLDQEPEAAKTWLNRIPTEFQPLVQTFSAEDIQRFLPPGCPFNNVPENNHNVIQMFMANNLQYEFVYSLEADLRLIGRWDHLLADIDEEYAFHRGNQEEDQHLPAVPDLVTFEALRQPASSWPWPTRECVDFFGGKSKIRNTLGPMWGWSRKLTESLTEMNRLGMNCYYEYFVPSTALREGLTTFFYQNPLYCPVNEGPRERISMDLDELGKNDPRLVQRQGVAAGCTYFWINPTSQPFWENWYREPEVCRPPGIIHPVKGGFFN